MISDGECSEGAVWESLRFINEHKLENIHIYVNANGWAAYDSVDLLYLEKRLKAFYPRINFVNTTVEKYGLSGLSAHYVNMTEDQYLKAVKSL
jgi:transketolase N-terminal domain/subunit